MAASIRVGFCLRKLYCQNFINSSTKVISCGYRRNLNLRLSEMYQLRVNIGPEPERHRSVWQNWNYNCELFAFAKRIGEDLPEDTLRVVFSHSSYIEREQKKRRELDIDALTVDLGLEDNDEFAKIGEVKCSLYIKQYLRHIYPLLFEEWISGIHDHLLSDQMFNYIGRHLGITDLMLCADFPAEDATVIKTLKALIGALHIFKGAERAQLFVRDFILPQLIGKDINEMWDVVNPMGLLSAILNSQKRGLPEPRLLWEAASKTILAVYHVGIYSDKQLVGKAPGETVVIAEEMAARNALKNIMKTDDGRPSLILGKLSENLKIENNRPNISCEQVMRKFSPKDSLSVSST